MRVLVTGATGFIGNYVIKELIKNGVKVIATSTNQETAKKTEWYNKVKFIPFTIESPINKNLFEYFENPDILIHLAWQGLPNFKGSFHLTENLPQQKEFLLNLLKNGLTNITVAGTCFEYGMQQGELTEEMPCYPDNAYAKAKNELRIFIDQLNINYKWIRLFYMYGKGQSPNSLIPQLEKAITNNETSFNMSGGAQIRDFLLVDEVAKNIVTIALQNKLTGIINCCSGKPISVKQFVKEYLTKKNIDIKLNLGFYPYTDYEPMEFWGNTNKLNIVKKIGSILK